MRARSATRLPAGAAAPAGSRGAPKEQGDPIDPESMDPFAYALLQGSQRTNKPVEGGFNNPAAAGQRQGDMSPSDWSYADSVRTQSPTFLEDRKLKAWDTSKSATNTKAVPAAEVNTMDAEARARVELNTALLQASQSDGVAGPNAPDVDSNAYKEYDATATRIFGSPQKTYAPNTLALLDALGASNLSGMSIDDFLSLENAAQGDELGHLAIGVLAPENPQNARNNLLTQLTQGVTDLTNLFDSGVRIDMASGSVPFELEQLGNAPARLNAFANPNAVAYGGERYKVPTSATTMDLTLGNNTPKSSTFDTAFAATAVKNPSVPFNFDELMGALRAEGYDPNEFIQYAGERIARYEDAKNSLNPEAALVPGYEALTPEEIRVALGLTGG